MPLESVLFEVISAISTVGLSLNLTTSLGIISRLILCILMFLGRIGAITLALAFTKTESVVSSEIEFPDSKLVVG